MIKKLAVLSSFLTALLLTTGCLPHHGMGHPNDSNRFEQHQTAPGQGHDAGRPDNARPDQFSHRQDGSRPQNAPGGSNGQRFDSRDNGIGRPNNHR